MKYLFIAEKPSLMRQVQSCYNNHKVEVTNAVGIIDFVALSGHICAYFMPTDYEAWADTKWADVQYPIIPNPWGIKAIDDAYKKKTIAYLRQNAKKYDGIIVGTDSDVEGYGIYSLIESFFGLQDMKALRFIEHSLTDKEILKSLLSMTDFHTDPTHVRFTQSFQIRSRADWLYGINASRMLSVKMNGKMRVGRVKSPTIKLVYDNSMAIENFKPKSYFILTANYGDFTSTLLTEDGGIAQFDEVSKIPKYPLQGIVKEKESKRTYGHAPKLFDLAAAQVEAGQKFGFAPDKTLEIIQSLYEKHKVISYPRTQCRFVSSEKAKEFPMMLGHMDVFDDLAGIAGEVKKDSIAAIFFDTQVVNDVEVQKESHDALLPTSIRPNLDAMASEERDICHMIFARLLAQFMPKLTEDKTKLLIQHGDGVFEAKGKMVIDPGWTVLYKNVRDSVIPALKKGDTIVAKAMQPDKRTTTPPKRLTQATLINAMINIASQIEDKELKKSLADSKGIGTSATRAAIIKDIISAGYVEDKKNGLYITAMGKSYVEHINNLGIIHPVFAAKMDTKIKQVQRGEADYNSVSSEILQGVYDMCAEIGKMEQSTSNQFSQIKESSVQCPKCESLFQIQKYSYTCPKCELKMPRFVCGREIDEKVLNRLVSGKISSQMVFQKKDGTKFKACLGMNKDGTIVFTSGLTCPLCGKELRLNHGGAFCESCGFKLFRKMAGHEFSDAEIKALLKKKRVEGITDFVSKAGKPFSAAVTMDDTGKLSFEFAKK